MRRELATSTSLMAAKVLTEKEKLRAEACCPWSVAPTPPRKAATMRGVRLGMTAPP